MPLTAAPSHRPRMEWVVTALLALFLVTPILATKAEADLWGHLRFGLDLLRSRHVPLADPYSFTQDRPWINHEWLSELAMGIAYTLAGVKGLIALKVGIIITGLLIVWRALGPLHPLVRAGLTALMAWSSSALWQTVRPQLWTWLFLIILVRVLQTRRRMWIIPPLFAVWVNLHGGWIVGAGILTAWCAVDATEQFRRSRVIPWPTLLLPVATAAATIVNPYGVELWTFLATTVRTTRPDIVEWDPLWTTPIAIWLPYVVLLASAIAITAMPRTRPTWPMVALLCVLAYGGGRVLRIAFLLGPGFVLVIGAALRAMWPRERWNWVAPSRAAAALAFIPIAAASFAVIVTLKPHLGKITLDDSYWVPDAAAMKALRESHASGRLVTAYNWGQYAIWYLWPDLRVSYDGRRETVYSAATMQVHGAIYRGEPAGDEWLASVRPEYVWLPTERETRRRWLVQHGYRIDVETARSFIAVRNDLATVHASANAAMGGNVFP